MSSLSPAAILFDVNGTTLAVYNNTAGVVNQPLLPIAGYDGYNSVTRYLLSDGQGALIETPGSNNVPVFSNGTITASGNDIFYQQYFGTQQINLIVNVTAAPTGTTPTITFTIQEVDPGNNTTVFGNSASTTAINGTGVFTAVLTTTHSSAVRVSWTVTGTTPSFTGMYVTITTKVTPDTQAVSGTVTATNISVGTDGAAALGFDTQVGGKVTTAAPTYTNGNLNALSLTTLGGLRVDGVYATGTANATAADAMVNGGYVTTAAPTYTTGQLNALSLDTAGNLRVTGTGGTFNNQSIGTDGAAALGFDTQVGGKVTTAAPTYTTGNLDALSLTTLGGLRVDGVYASGTANATAADLMANGGYVTTAAPTYTTGQLSALSLDTSGNLRVTALTNKAGTATVTSVAVPATTATSLLAANTSRVFASLYNNGSKGTAYVLLGGGTASAANFSIVVLPASYWEIPTDFQGAVSVFATNASTLLVTELTP
jgi:hypothetical protein